MTAQNSASVGHVSDNVRSTPQEAVSQIDHQSVDLTSRRDSDLVSNLRSQSGSETSTLQPMSIDMGNGTIVSSGDGTVIGGVAGRRDGAVGQGGADSNDLETGWGRGSTRTPGDERLDVLRGPARTPGDEQIDVLRGPARRPGDTRLDVLRDNPAPKNAVRAIDAVNDPNYGFDKPALSSAARPSGPIRPIAEFAANIPDSPSQGLAPPPREIVPANPNLAPGAGGDNHQPGEGPKPTSPPDSGETTAPAKPAPKQKERPSSWFDL